MKNKEIEELLNKFKNADSQQFNELVEDFDNVYKLLSYIEQLQNNRDKAIEYNEHLIEHAKYHLNLGHLKKMRKLLKGGSDDE